MTVNLIRLLPEGFEAEPLFDTEKKYLAFRQDYINEVGPKLIEWDLARARSERDSMCHLVD
ncbi:MAG: hypothetical protein AABX66_02490 [Nanoarchaeota archaeon]